MGHWACANGPLGLGQWAIGPGPLGLGQWAHDGGDGGGGGDDGGGDSGGDGCGNKRLAITTKVTAALLVIIAKLKKDGMLEAAEAGRYKDLVLAGTPPPDLLTCMSMLLEKEAGVPADVEIGSDYEESD